MKITPLYWTNGRLGVRCTGRMEGWVFVVLDGWKVGCPLYWTDGRLGVLCTGRMEGWVSVVLDEWKVGWWPVGLRYPL